MARGSPARRSAPGVRGRAILRIAVTRPLTRYNGKPVDSLAYLPKR